MVRPERPVTLTMPIGNALARGGIAGLDILLNAPLPFGRSYDFLMKRINRLPRIVFVRKGGGRQRILTQTRPEGIDDF